MKDAYVAYNQIVGRLEISSDDTVVIASDIKKLAFMAFRNERSFNPNEFIDSFKTKLSNGNLLIHSFTDRLKNHDTYSVLDSKPVTGVLSDVALKRSDMKRSYDPFHSCMVLGKDQNEIVKIKSNSTFGEHSLFEFLHKKKAKMLLIDVSMQNSFTFVHYVEEQEKVPYRKMEKNCIRYINEHGDEHNKEFYFYKRRKGYLNELNKLEEIFEKENIIKKICVNTVMFKIIDLEKAYERIIKDIRENNAANLHRFSMKEYLKDNARCVYDCFR